MPIRPDCIRRPKNPVPRDYVPATPAIKHKVKDGESWQSLAKELGARLHASFDPWYLIRFNYPTLPSDNKAAALEVNWYLQEYVGCSRLTPDSANYVFSSSDRGHVFLPATPHASPSAPTLNTIKERRDSIMANIPGVFVVNEDPTGKPTPAPWYSMEAFEEVSANLEQIGVLAQRYRLDPDFVKAIVWIETTHGYYDRLDPWNKTIRPMNVHTKLWSDLGISREDMKKSPLNIAAGVHILAAIWERTADPTVAKVATLYNQLGATSVSAYGKTVEQYMKQRPWLLRR
jgi:hypothetical protein